MTLQISGRKTAHGSLNAPSPQAVPSSEFSYVGAHQSSQWETAATKNVSMGLFIFERQFSVIPMAGFE
ncbi:hypothetical protein [Bradyrhizobium sp.]|uniref:hypothetical protein n=1 Tax=Bradyrhizobium sp. TaxID=376 RepID=UPI002DDCE0A1|nr:hypothetical protein [Bradyrhizobium sp.]HEV2160569.1 hypothetical protein [Bradyrhizobium sp.]